MDLLAAEDAGDRLTDETLTQLLVLLVVAWHETTVNLITNGFWALWHDAAARERVQTTGLTATGTEELLHLMQPFNSGRASVARRRPSGGRRYPQAPGSSSLPKRALEQGRHIGPSPPVFTACGKSATGTLSSTRARAARDLPHGSLQLLSRGRQHRFDAGPALHRAARPSGQRIAGDIVYAATRPGRLGPSLVKTGRGDGGVSRGVQKPRPGRGNCRGIRSPIPLLAGAPPRRRRSGGGEPGTCDTSSDSDGAYSGLFEHRFRWKPNAHSG